MMHTIKVPKQIVIIVLFIVIFDLLVISALNLVGSLRNIPLGVMTSDPATVTGEYFIGFLSNFGIMLWASSAAICFFSAFLLRDYPGESRFLLFSGLFITFLTLDDAFMLHDGLIPYFVSLPEWPVYAVYLLLILAYFIFFFRDIISMTYYPVLALALLLFGISIGYDLFLKSFPTQATQPFYEDGIKFLGITLWVAYYLIANVQIVKPHINGSMKVQPKVT